MIDDPQPASSERERQPQEQPPEGATVPIIQAVETRRDAPIEIDARSASNQNPTQQDEEKRQKILERATVWQKWCAVAIAIFTLAQVVVGYWQWDATDKQYKSMEKQLDIMKLDQRPWMKIDGEMSLTITSGKPIRAAVAVKNTGKRPGHITKASLALHLIEEARLAEAIEVQMKARTGKWNSVISPESTAKFITSEQSAILDDEDMRSLKVGDVMLFLIVILEYGDGPEARMTHTTFGCYVCDPNTGLMRTYERYNTMD